MNTISSGAVFPRWRGILPVLGSLTLLLAGCRQEVARPSAPSAKNYVARIEGISITSEEVTDALSKRFKALAVNQANGELRQQVLEELIRERVLLARARAAGVDRDPELIRRWERMVVAKYESSHKPDAEKRPAPSIAEVEQFYREHASEYGRPERIRVALIQVKGSAKATEEKRIELRARAEQLLALAQAPDADFAELARLHSDDRATRYSGGDGGWMERGQTPPSWPKDLSDAVFTLEKAGVVAPLVEAGGSFYILKLIERQAPGIQPLAEVRDRIVHQLREQQRVANEERFYAEQKAGLRVEINQAALEAIPLPAPVVAKAPGAPPALPAN